MLSFIGKCNGRLPDDFYRRVLNSLVPVFYPRPPQKMGAQAPLVFSSEDAASVCVAGLEQEGCALALDCQVQENVGGVAGGREEEAGWLGRCGGTHPNNSRAVKVHGTPLPDPSS